MGCWQKSLAYTGVKIWESLDPNLKVQPFFFLEEIEFIPPKPILILVKYKLPACLSYLYFCEFCVCVNIPNKLNWTSGIWISHQKHVAAVDIAMGKSPCMHNVNTLAASRFQRFFTKKKYWNTRCFAWEFLQSSKRSEAQKTRQVL